MSHAKGNCCKHSQQHQQITNATSWFHLPVCSHDQIESKKQIFQASSTSSQARDRREHLEPWARKQAKRTMYWHVNNFLAQPHPGWNMITLGRLDTDDKLRVQPDSSAPIFNRIIWPQIGLQVKHTFIILVPILQCTLQQTSSRLEWKTKRVTIQYLDSWHKASIHYCISKYDIAPFRTTIWINQSITHDWLL